jgi:hypothetical protein
MASAPVLATEPTAIEPAPKSAAAIIKIPNTVANAISIASLTNLRPELFGQRDREQIAREEGHEIRGQTPISPTSVMDGQLAFGVLRSSRGAPRLMQKGARWQRFWNAERWTRQAAASTWFVVRRKPKSSRKRGTVSKYSSIQTPAQSLEESNSEGSLP